MPNPVRILAVATAWQNGMAQFGPWVVAPQFFGSIVSSGLFETVGIVHYDTWQCWVDGQRVPFTGDMSLVAVCQQLQPHLVVYHNIPWNVRRPTPETWRIVTEQMGIPLVMLWFDSDGDLVQAIDAEFPMASLHCHVNGLDPHPFTGHPDRHWSAWTPQDDRVVFDDGRIRDVLVSFAGRLKEDRADLVHALLSAGIPLVCPDRTSGDIAAHDYYDLLRRSHVTINAGGSQLKSRTLEAVLCGACLLEASESPTSRFFRPDVEYVPYRDRQDLIDRIRDLIVHPEQAARIACAGRERARAEYSARAFWSHVLTRSGIV